LEDVDTRDKRGMTHHVCDASQAFPMRENPPVAQSPSRSAPVRAVGIGIVLIEKGSQSLDILSGVGRKKDHPTLRGCGRGSSFADLQLAIHALTSSSETASRVCSNSP